MCATRHPSPERQDSDCHGEMEHAERECEAANAFEVKQASEPAESASGPEAEGEAYKPAECAGSPEAEGQAYEPADAEAESECAGGAVPDGPDGPGGRRRGLRCSRGDHGGTSTSACKRSTELRSVQVAVSKAMHQACIARLCGLKPAGSSSTRKDGRGHTVSWSTTLGARRSSQHG